MAVKRRDFQKAVNFLQGFQLKLMEGEEAAALRDSLNLCLLHMQKYYKLLKWRTQEQLGDSVRLSSSLSRGLSPITPFRDAPDRFQWKFVNLENPSIVTLTKSLSDGGVGGSSELFGAALPALLQATKLGDLPTVSRILAQDGVEALDAVDGLGRNCVMYAIHYKQHDLLKLFLEQGVDPNRLAHDNSTAAHRACHDNSGVALQALREYGADLTRQDVEGRSALHWAASLHDSQCLELLLAAGVPVTCRDNEGMTPAMWACRMDCKAALDRLQAAADFNSFGGHQVEKDTNGRTWVHWAVRRSEPLKCLTALLTPESNLVTDAEGKSPMHVAAEQGALAAARLVLDVCGGQSVGLVDGQGRTPLHLAAACGHGEMVNLLCERGADIDAVDRSGATAWDLAVSLQLHYCILILQYYKQQQQDGGGGGAATTAKPPFISPRPPNFPHSRGGSTPTTPRSRIFTGRSSGAKRPSNRSMNGSESPPEDDLAASTFRSSTASLVYPQKKQRTSESPPPVATHVTAAVAATCPSLPEEQAQPPAQHAPPAETPEARYQNRLVMHDPAEDRPQSAAGSDMTDVSVPMNVSEDGDPPTVIYNPPPPPTHAKPATHPKLDANHDPSQAAVERRSRSGYPDRQSRQLIQPTLAHSRSPPSGLHLHSSGVTPSPFEASSRSPESALSPGSTIRATLSSNPIRPVEKRAQSRSPTKPVPAQLSMEDAALMKEQQLAEMHFTPLHRRASPGGHLEPLGKLPVNVTAAAAAAPAGKADDYGQKRSGKKKKKHATESEYLPRSGHLQPLDTAIHGSSYPIYNSAKRREKGAHALDAIENRRLPNTRSPDRAHPVPSPLSPIARADSGPHPLPAPRRAHLPQPVRKSSGMAPRGSSYPAGRALPDPRQHLRGEPADNTETLDDLSGGDGHYMSSASALPRPPSLQPKHRAKNLLNSHLK